jgi:hypothetical protein
MERLRLKPTPTIGLPSTQLEVGQGRGRPSLYNPQYVKMAEAHCRLGATTSDLAEMFSVSTVTIETWAATHSEFGEAVKKGKAAWDDRVERSLAQRAIGYTADVEEVKVNKDGGLVRYTVRKHFPPDTTACIFWLKNRRREQWRDVQDHNHSGKLAVENLTADQLLEEIRTEATALGLVPPQPSNKRSSAANKTQH